MESDFCWRCAETVMAANSITMKIVVLFIMMRLKKVVDRRRRAIFSLHLLTTVTMVLIRCRCNPLVEAAADTEEHDAYGAKGYGHLAAAIALECGQRIVVGLDVHCLDDEQVVVEADYRIDKGDEHHEISEERTFLCCRHEDEEL